MVSEVDFKLNHIVLSSDKLQKIEFSRSQNQNKSGLSLFDGNHVLSIEVNESFGAVQFHELKNNICDFHHYKFAVEKSIDLNIRARESTLGLYFPLKGNFQCSIKESRDVLINKYEFGLLYLPETRLTCHLEAGEEYSCLAVHFTPEYFAMFTNTIPAVGSVLERIGKIELTVIGRKNATDPEILTVLQNLLQCPYSDALKQTYLDIKAHELLLLCLTKNSTGTGGAIKGLLHKSDIEKIHTVKDHIIHHLDNPGTLKDIAHMIGINEFKLKQGFKRIFNTTVFGMLFEERMQKAQQLLSDTEMTIEEISAVAGYKNHSNFTSAFKKRFGYPPNALRK
ncbi:AraC family transcriptional regulator [Cytophagales bacterium WSM2-2]|nr:AraC family transcriptional regulator [Cytophagales bacterium WSM2-2]